MFLFHEPLRVADLLPIHVARALPRIAHEATGPRVGADLAVGHLDDHEAAPEHGLPT